MHVCIHIYVSLYHLCADDSNRVHAERARSEEGGHGWTESRIWLENRGGGGQYISIYLCITMPMYKSRYLQTSMFTYITVYTICGEQGGHRRAESRIRL